MICESTLYSMLIGNKLAFRLFRNQHSTINAGLLDKKLFCTRLVSLRIKFLQYFQINLLPCISFEHAHSEMLLHASLLWIFVQKVIAEELNYFCIPVASQIFLDSGFDLVY